LQLELFAKPTYYSSSLSILIKITRPKNSIIIQNKTHTIINGIPNINGSALLAIEKTGNININKMKQVKII